MDNRITAIKELVMQSCERLRAAGISVDESTVEEMVKKFTVEGIDEKQARFDIEKTERSIRTKHEIEVMLSKELEGARNLQNLSVQHKGITLNIQDIDLMMIANSHDFESLELVLSKITNISAPTLLENEGFVEYRQRVFDSYLNALTSRNEYNANNGIEMARKLEYLRKRISAEEMALVDKAVAKNSEYGHIAIINGITAAFRENYSSNGMSLEEALALAQEKVDGFLRTIREFSPIEKEGIKGTTIEAYQELEKQVRYFYDSITIDEEAKYGKVILQNGAFEDKYLRKCLDYARSLGKTVRINTLMFYMDCPRELFELEENDLNRKLVREKLGFYVDSVTKVFEQYPDVVRSVDIFNELLNRHPVAGDVPYTLRSDFPQEKDAKGNYDDNTQAGWLKHLSLDDLCGVLAIARHNLPNVDFMYNDDFLTDPKKMEATLGLIKELQDYAKGNGVKLIDSIGTQMHLDNNVTKEEIRNMFLALSTLGLPIEITEFDLAMTSNVEGLTSEEIEIIRQHKINEVYEVIEELREQCNIRGFTIWSKTDSQNFRVDLDNMERIKSGKQPITSLHGGMFTEGMIPKSAEMAKLVRKQNFNYHGHTSRCGHAADMDDETYVLAARNQGITSIGFSDHVAFDTLEQWQQGQRMHVSEVDDYLKSIRELQDKYPDMTIRCGFEAEYDPSKMGYLADLRSKCDYMILGQHYVQSGMGIASRSDPNYPLIYAEMVCKAMDTGIFDIVAHPDYFMMFRDRMKSPEEYDEFMKNAAAASRMICSKASDLGIPIELNVRGALEHKEMSDGEFAYPHSLFWDIAAQEKCTVIYGVDAHHPSHMLTIDEDRERLAKHIDTSKLKLVETYDPVVARENNEKLQTRYEETKRNSVTQETSLVQMIMAGVEVKEGDDAFERIGDMLTAIGDKFGKACTAEQIAISEEIKRVDDDTSYSDSEKVAMKARYELRRERVLETAKARERMLARATMSLSEAKEAGCKTKAEYIQVVGYLTEAKTSNDPQKRSNASAAVQAFSESKQQGTAMTTSQAPKVYTYNSNSGNNSGNNNSSSSSDSGFTSSLNLLLAIGLLVIFGIAVVFMIG